MKAIYLFLFVLFFSTSCFSDTTKYIMIGTSTSKKEFNYVKSKLNTLHLKMLARKSGNNYVLYSGPYNDERSLALAKQKITRYFPHAKVINPESQNEDENTNETVSSTDFSKSGFNVAVSVGYNKNTPKHTIISGTVNANIPKDTGLSYALESAYLFENDISLSLGYASMGTGDIVLTNIYGGVEYQHTNSSDFTPYYGLLFGMGQLSWSKSPLSGETSSSSSSLFGGIRIGVKYEILKDLDIFSAYELLFMSHTQDVISGASNTSVIEHSNVHNLQIGLRYYF